MVGLPHTIEPSFGDEPDSIGRKKGPVDGTVAPKQNALSDTFKKRYS